MFSRLLFTTSILFSLSNGAGTYDGYYFDDTQEKYSIFYLNTCLATELEEIGLSSTDANFMLAARPITSLTSFSSNSNIAGKDMFYIRQRSAAVTIPDQSIYSDMNTSLGMRISDANFLYGLTGLLVGLGFMFGLLYLIVRK